MANTIWEHVVNYEIQSLRYKLKTWRNRFPNGNNISRTLEAELAKLEGDIFCCHGDIAILNETYENVRTEYNQVGSAYLVFDDKYLYIPSIQYGRYITTREGWF